MTMQGQNSHKKSKVVMQKPPELNEQALHSLVGYFDVLIQMDLAQKVSNEIRSKDNERDRENTNNE